jgi:aspartate carbamoyltransferase catalytic subunit
VTLVGDLKNGRTVHSLALLISRGDFKGVRLCYVTPPELRMPHYIKEHISKTTAGALEQKEEEDFAVALKTADVVYMTRVQKERFEKEEDYDNVKGTYVLTSALLQAHAKEKMAVLHPLPRVDEIATDCDDDPRAAYFRQMKNGMYVRMALLGLTLGVPPP